MKKNKKIKKKKIEEIEHCPICEQSIGQHGFGCEKCGQTVCEGCFDNDTDKCIDCKE